MKPQKLIGGSIEAMRKLQKFDEYEEEYFRKRPEEIDDYLKIVFDEYAQDGDTGALLSSLRVLARVKGVSALEIGRAHV